jgi:transcriptional regulator with XRE-family HTH domain
VTRGGVEGCRGDRLRVLRQKGGWSLAALAAAADTNPNSLSRIERGEQAPQAPLLVRLAELLEVETTELAPLPEHPTLRQLRERVGQTQAELAKGLGVSPNTVSTTERGVSYPRKPDRWAQAYGVTPTRFKEAWQAARTNTASRRRRGKEH